MSYVLVIVCCLCPMGAATSCNQACAERNICLV